MSDESPSKSASDKRYKPPGRLWAVMCLVIVTHLLVFWRHYLGYDYFPWDFWKSYFAFVSFWTSLARHGFIPEWVPFEYMGYPFFINPQSGFFYPPLWVFVLPGLHYSLQTAAIVQCLHVLWGACGVFLLVRVITGQLWPALLGALAYHFFGGFYCNAEHSDIVRAYSWLPWLFWSATPGNRLVARNYLLPLVIYCVVSSSYPGNIASHLFVVGLYILGVTYYHDQGNGLRLFVQMSALVALGLLLCTVVVLPAFLMRRYLYHFAAHLPTNNWTTVNWLSLISPWAVGNAPIRGFTGDPSMISAYVGVPVVALAFSIRKRNPDPVVLWWIIFAVSLSLAAGESSAFYSILARLCPLLSMSRFPSSDYRGLIALALIVLAAMSLKQWLQAGDTPSSHRLLRGRLLCVSLIPIAVLGGVFIVLIPTSELLWIIGMWLIVGAILWLQTTPLRFRKKLSVALILAAVLVQGFHTIYVSQWTWTGESSALENFYQKKLGFSTKTHHVGAFEKLHSLSIRPARMSLPRQDFAWAGYLDGTFQTNDYSNTELIAQYNISHEETLRAFMQKPSTVAIFPGVKRVTKEMLLQKLGQSETGTTAAKDAVAPLKFGLNSEQYRIQLSSDSVVVMNEIWFPGWEGQIWHGKTEGPGVIATNVDEALRAWQLPAGSYRLKTRFTTPYLRSSLAISAVALLLYIIVILHRLVSPRLREKTTSGKSLSLSLPTTDTPITEKARSG